MSKLLKDVFNQDFFLDFTTRFSQLYPLNQQAFLKDIFIAEWQIFELKDRMKHTARVLHSHLPISYKKQASLLCNFVEANKSIQNSDWMLAYMFLPEFIIAFGRDDFDTSIQSIEKITQFTSCEFAIRTFILQQPVKAMKQMLAWSTHKEHTVRRLSCEGCRPRLPWAQKLQFLIYEPSPILPILENLKNDNSNFVRTSVSNNLNDISKDHSEVVLSFAQQNINTSKNLNKIIKHALRTLLKQGNIQAMSLFGFNTNAKIGGGSIQLKNNNTTPTVALEFEFTVKNEEKIEQLIRIEYAIYFLRKNGNYSKKVFFISEKKYASQQEINVCKQYSFKPISTRAYYSGKQYVSIIINGVEKEKTCFELSIS